MATNQVIKPEQNDTTNKKEICFTIMPFGGWFDLYYNDIIHPAIEKAGLHSKRADDTFRPGVIIRDIWNDIKKAKVILAVLTEKNPNVLYELGLAHAIAKPAIIVSENIEDIPFDLRGLRAVKYDKNEPDWGGKLQKQIVEAISELIETPLEYVLPAFLETDDIQKEKRISTHEKELLEIRRKIELLESEFRRSQESAWTWGTHSMPTAAAKHVYGGIKKGLLGGDISHYDYNDMRRLLDALEARFGKKDSDQSD